MQRSFNAPILACLTALCSATVAAPASAPGGAAAAPGRTAAATACERAAQDTLRETRGATATASFAAAPVLAPVPADAAEVTYRGSGQVRAASGTRPFSYSCTFDTRTNTVTGVVLRDAGAPGQTPPAAQAVEPDLSQISPTACESAAAGALKQRWPSVAAIHFNADTRQLSQQDGGNASLRGQGIATPAVRAPTTHFSYDCTVDPRNGRIVGVRIAD
jgi:hypothetical protein